MDAPSLCLPDSGVNLPKILRETERYYILAALVAQNGNHTRAARHLGMNRTTFVMKLKKYGFPLKPSNHRKPQDQSV